MTRPATNRGFSLLEVLVVTALIIGLMTVVFGQIHLVQKRYKAEEAKLDITQESRAFLEQIVRDLHQAGYPNSKMYMAGVLTSPAQNDSRNAAGLVKFSYTDLWFEGDVDGDGQVESVRYTLQADGSNECPCAISRSQVLKLNSTAPMSQPLNYATALENVVNSGGAGGSGANGSLALGGNSIVNGAGGMSTAANDTLYAGYKPAYVFAAFDAYGNAVAPTDITTGPLALASIRTIQITLNVLAPASGADIQTRQRPASAMTATARIMNH